MDTNQKAEALAALAELAVHFREKQWRIGDKNPWYVQQAVEVKEPGGCLAGRYGNGPSPDAAIEDHWRVLVTDLPADRYLVVHAMRDSRRAVRWNGFMWADVPEPHLEKV